MKDCQEHPPSDSADAIQWRHMGQPPCFYQTKRFYSDKASDKAIAKAICQTCSMIEECLDTALAKPEEYGVWGGLTADERRVYSTRSLLGLHPVALRRNTQRVQTH